MKKYLLLLAASIALLLNFYAAPAANAVGAAREPEKNPVNCASYLANKDSQQSSQSQPTPSVDGRCEDQRHELTTNGSLFIASVTQSVFFAGAILLIVGIAVIMIIVIKKRTQTKKS